MTSRISHRAQVAGPRAAWPGSAAWRRGRALPACAAPAPCAPAMSSRGASRAIAHRPSWRVEVAVVVAQRRAGASRSSVKCSASSRPRAASRGRSRSGMPAKRQAASSARLIALNSMCADRVQQRGAALGRERRALAATVGGRRPGSGRSGRPGTPPVVAGRAHAVRGSDRLRAPSAGDRSRGWRPPCGFGSRRGAARPGRAGAGMHPYNYQLSPTETLAMAIYELDGVAPQLGRRRLGGRQRPGHRQRRTGRGRQRLVRRRAARRHRADHASGATATCRTGRCCTPTPAAR